MQHRIAEAKGAVRRLFDASAVDATMASMNEEVSEESRRHHSSIFDLLGHPVSRSQLHVGVTLQVSGLAPLS